MRRVLFLVFPQFQALDLTGPLEVFARAPGYQTEIVALDPDPVVATNGMRVLPDATLDEVSEQPVDTLVVAGGRGTRAAMRDPRHTEWITAMAGKARRTASVCTGAFLLAAGGLLDGRRAVTHWSSCAELAAAFPAVRVDPDPIFIRDGPVWTSAGITAGIDLALALVEADRGGELAREIARNLVVFVQRPGGQAQFSTQLAAQRPGREPLRRVQDWIADHLDADLSLSALAARAALSERHFSRVFRAETGMTVAAYVEAVRLEAARRLLESTGDSLERIARACGFGAVETMHRSFLRRVRVTPGQYRRHFTIEPEEHRHAHRHPAV